MKKPQLFCINYGDIFLQIYFSSYNIENMYKTLVCVIFFEGINIFWYDSTL